MSKSVCVGIVFLTVACLGVSSSALGAIVIDDPSDLFTSADVDLGDYYAVGGKVEASSPGQVLEVLGGPQGTLQGPKPDPEVETRSISIGSMWDTLYAGGVTEANVLGFVIGTNQTGSTGSNWVSIDELDMTFTDGTAGPYTYSLGSESIEVYNYIQGGNTSEAIIWVELPFDFVANYSSDSAEQLTIYGEIGHISDGFEIIMFSSGFSGGDGGQVPEPASILMWSMLGGLGLACQMYRRRKAA